MSLYAHRGGTVAVPDAPEPVVAPIPPAVAPAQAADAQAAITAVDGAPEEDAFRRPLLGDEMRISEQVIEDIGIEYEGALVRQLLAEFVAVNGPTVLLVVVEIEFDVRRVKGELTTLLVLLNPHPSVRKQWVDVAVDDVRGAGLSGHSAHEKSPQMRYDQPGLVVIAGRFRCSETSGYDQSVRAKYTTISVF